MIITKTSAKIKWIFFALLLCLVAIFGPTMAFATGFDAETIYQSVFVIQTDGSVGSGFAIGPNCIVTNAHTVEGSDRIRITAYNGKTYPALIVLLDLELDVAVLSVPDGNFPCLTATSVEASIGDDAYAIGAPENLSFTLTKGIVSAKNRQIGSNSYIQVDTAINPGNSGGPLVSNTGEVLGIVTMKLSGSEGIGLAIPIQTVCAYLKKNGISLTEHGNVEGLITGNGQEKSQSNPEEESALPTKMGKPSLVIPLCISVALNILLLFLLVLKLRKRRMPDPNRTDFEIDVWE